MGRISSVVLVALTWSCDKQPGSEFDASDLTCPAPGPRPPHVVGFTDLGNCNQDPICEDGWFDCDPTMAGCESRTDCAIFPQDAAVPFNFPWYMQGTPHGIALCNDAFVFVDGSRVLSARVGELPITLATLDGEPSGGVACDDSFVYVGTRSTFKQPSDGRLLRLPRNGGPMVDLASNVDPAPWLDLDDAGNVYWISRKPTGTLVVRTNLDASADLLPASEPQVYKNIGLYEGLWAIDNGAVRHLWTDASVDVLADASAVALTPRASGMSVLYQVPGGFSFSRVDGGNPFVGVIAVVAFKEDIFLAENTGIYHVPPKGPPTLLLGGFTDPADLAVDATYVYYTRLSGGLDRIKW